MKSNKVSVVCAVRLMMKVYSPLLDFYKSMKKNDCKDYLIVITSFVSTAIDKSLNCDIDYFKNIRDYVYSSITIHKVCEDIVKIHRSYFKEYGDNFFMALSTIFRHLENNFKSL